MFNLLLRYKLLLLDHDDTSIDSTPDYHYKYYLEFMKERFPDRKPLTL